MTDRYTRGNEKIRKPNTPVQAEAWSRGYKAFLNDVKITENPENTDVRFTWWRHGWLMAHEDWLANG